jgi:TRAP-type C4-dicarboxylate transport system permease small subunit
MLDRIQSGLGTAGLWFERALYIVCGALLTFISINMFCAVLSRYVFKSPLPWTEELARYALVWFALLAAALSARRGVHISFRWGLLLFSPAARHAIRIAIELVILAFLAIVLWQSISLLDVVGNQTAMATQMNMRVPYAGVPVGIAALIIVYALEIADSLLAVWTGRCLTFKSAQEAKGYRQLAARGAPLPD